MKILSILVIVLLTLQASAQPSKVTWKKVNVLVYTRNGKGYVHDNLASATAGIQKLGAEHGFNVTATDDPAVFTPGKLNDFTLLVFASTNNDVFDTDAQRLAFRQYIEAGGALVGIHSVMGTERNWTWFKQLIGGTFLWHPAFQPLTLKVMDTSHPSMQGLPHQWKKRDECYFIKEMYAGVQVLMAHDLSALNGDEAEKVRTAAGSFAGYYPAAWHQRYDGGTVWITTLGHDKTDYADAQFLQHILNGMAFVAAGRKPLDTSRAYATHHDDPLR